MPQIPSIGLESSLIQSFIGATASGEQDLTSSNVSVDGDGNSYLTVTHTSVTGATQNGLTLTPIVNLGGVDYWVTAVTATSFTIHVAGLILPGTTYSFTWSQFPW